jgi:predicted nucleotidyltransferase component of viral defense system
MLKFANLSNKDREDVFRNTAHLFGMNEAIVEKDFWVCWTMNYLFHQSKWKRHFAFKGGTSLSKGYGLIKRFSEDIDLILDWCLLGYTVDEPWKERSKTKQDKFNKETDSKAEDFLKNEFVPRLKMDFSNMLTESYNLNIYEDEPQTVCFAYPQAFEDSSVLKVIRMEIGALAAWTPTQNLTIKSYAAEKYPKIFSEPGTTVLTVSSERTFWEKVTILHKEAFRTNGHFPERYSRHYYDLYCMNVSSVKQNAFANLELLDRVVAFKARFYPTNVARYDLAKPGTLRLIPPDNCIQILERDYEHMQNMIYGYKPEFSEIMKSIQQLEKEINNLNLER